MVAEKEAERGGWGGGEKGVERGRGDRQRGSGVREREMGREMLAAD